MKIAFRAWLIAAAVVIVTGIFLDVPHVVDMPRDTSISEFSLRGSRYLMVNGLNDEGLGYMSVYRTYQADSTTIHIDKVQAFYPLFSPGPISNLLPIVIDVKTCLPGHWKVKIRREGRYTEVYSFDVARTAGAT